jgi:hypothetical protein
MAIPLSNRNRWAFVAGVVALGLGYLFLTGKEFAASVYASSGDLTKLERAVRFSPGNADYRHRLGRYLEFVSEDPQAAVENLRAAVALNPHDAHYWFDLAGAYQVTGDIASQRTALDHALQAEPTAPDVAWEAANFFLIDGEIDRALSEFRVVIENEASLVDASLRACWRVRPDADALLRDVVPARADSLISFSYVLRSQKDVDGVIKTWDKLALLHQPLPRKDLYEIVKYLIGAHRPDAAMALWKKTADAMGLAGYLPTEDNVVVNGDFDLDILNGGFDWTYVNRPGVRPVLDPSELRQGHRSLSLTFEGPGINDAGIQELIPVQGPNTYDFSAFYKSEDFEGAGGPAVVLRDAYTGAVLYASDSLRDADFWKEVHSKVTVPAATILLVLAIERFPAGSPIRGKLWLDDFELAPADTSDDSSGNSTTSSFDNSTSGNTSDYSSSGKHSSDQPSSRKSGPATKANR